MELKPCPFCGGTGMLHKKKSKYYVECNGDCWTVTNKYATPDDAVSEWNNFERMVDDE